MPRGRETGGMHIPVVDRLTMALHRPFESPATRTIPTLVTSTRTTKSRRTVIQLQRPVLE